MPADARGVLTRGKQKAAAAARQNERHLFGEHARIEVCQQASCSFDTTLFRFGSRWIALPGCTSWLPAREGTPPKPQCQAERVQSRTARCKHHRSHLNIQLQTP